MTFTKPWALVKVAALSFIMAAVAGCATKETPVASVDTFCLTAKKRVWYVTDTPETIQAAESWNLAIDRKCGGKKKA